MPLFSINTASHVVLYESANVISYLDCLDCLNGAWANPRCERVLVAGVQEHLPELGPGGTSCQPGHGPVAEVLGAAVAATRLS